MRKEMEFFKRGIIHCKRCISVRAIHQTRAAANLDKSSGAPEPPAAERASSTSLCDPESGGWARRVVSGLQPTGALHVGNYFAALRRLVRLQDAGDDTTLFVADLHALTTRHDPATLQENSLDLTALALAAGWRPERGALFLQSAVGRHAELCWVLGCLATRARLEAQPAFRDKAAGLRDVPLGLMLYPVLQAADVLLHRATHVPVGADQRQHLHVAAALARSFAARYGPAFPAPRALLPEDGGDRVRSLREPGKKMSKSDPDARSRILLTDDAAAIELKIRKAVTDCTPEVTWDPEGRPGVSNLVRLHCLATGLTPATAVAGAGGLSTAQYKREVAAALAAALGRLRARHAELRARPRLLRGVLAAGAARAQLRADETYADVAARVGIAAPALPPRRTPRTPDAAVPAVPAAETRARQKSQ